MGKPAYRAYIYFTQQSNITLAKPKLNFQLLDFHIQNYKKYPRSEWQGTEKHGES